MKNIIKKIKTYTKKLYVNTTCVLKIKTIKMKKKTVIFCLDSNHDLNQTTLHMVKMNQYESIYESI